MESKAVKLCEDCKHFYRGDNYLWCHGPHLRDKRMSSVVSSPVVLPEECVSERLDRLSDHCGPEARYWAPKPQTMIQRLVAWFQSPGS